MRKMLNLRSQIVPGVCALLIASLAWVEPVSGDAVYDDESPRKTSTVIPDSLIQGDVWKVDPEVVPNEGLFQFQVSTPWGNFPAYGEAMLRLRLKEFHAIAELQEVSSTEAGVVGAGRSVKKSFVRLGNAFIHPKRTARAMPQGTRRLYGKINRYAGKIKEAIAEDEDENSDADQNPLSTAPLEAENDSAGKAQQAAVWLARKYGGVSSKIRRRAREFGVDPYTSNEVLAEELDRLAKAEAIGSYSSKFFLPVFAGGIGLMADAVNIAYIQEWREIFVYNAGLMEAMGVDEDAIIAFQTNEFYTPMTQTLLVAMLDAMEGSKNRAIVIEQANLLQNESEALFFLESIMLAEWYHREKSELRSFVFDTLIPVAVNERGNLVAFTAADYFYWTEEAAKVAKDFTTTYATYSGGRELVTADYVSPLARKEIEALGWALLPELRLTYDVEIPWGRQDR